MVRRSTQSKKERKAPPSADEADQLRHRIAELECENDKLRHENHELQEKLKAVSREALRQAAPFRRREGLRTHEPKRPGRRAGHPGARRPRPQQVDETIEAPLRRCPHCGGRVTDVRPIRQVVEDVPLVRPFVSEIVTYAGYCHDCGTVRSTHPRQVSNASGAAGVQVGPRAAAIATDLNKHLGVPAAKTCTIMKEHFGLNINPGGLVQLEARIAQRLEPAYKELATLIRRSRVVHADETSWWVGGPGYWLWVFTNRKLTFYIVDRRRSRDVVEDVIGESYAGVLVSDCLVAYEHLNCRQQKCYAHHLRAIAKAKEVQPSSRLLAEAQLLLKSALAVSALRKDLQRKHYLTLVARLEAWADKLLDPDTPVDCPKIAARLRKRRRHLFTFLYDTGVDATNNAAERALRPAVIARKVSCGNRTERGKKTWQILASIAATCGQQQRSFTKLLESVVPIAAPVPSLRAPSRIAQYTR